MADIEQLYLHEIQLMLHGCGDCARPLLSTVKLVASIVQQQVLCISWRAEEQAARRGSKIISPRDIIFLMRKNPDKLRRLYTYLSVKEMKSKFTALTGSEMVDVTEDLDGDVTKVMDSAKRSRQASLKDLFVDIDTSGELLDSLNDGCSDPIKQKRDQRADSISQSLDPVGYLEFANARRAAFVNNKLTQQRFLEWIALAIDTSPGLIGEPLGSLPRMTSASIDILAYLAKETVAMLVDFALLVRQDACGSTTGGPLRPLTLRPLNTPSTSVNCDKLPLLPLSPSEIREALRRYLSPLFSQSAGLVRTGPPLACQLIAC